MGQIKVYIVFFSSSSTVARGELKLKEMAWEKSTVFLLFCHSQTKPSILLVGYYGIFHSGQLIITVLMGIYRSFYILCVL